MFSTYETVLYLSFQHPAVAVTVIVYEVSSLLESSVYQDIPLPLAVGVKKAADGDEEAV